MYRSIFLSFSNRYVGDWKLKITSGISIFCATKFSSSILISSSIFKSLLFIIVQLRVSSFKDESISHVEYSTKISSSVSSAKVSNISILQLLSKSQLKLVSSKSFSIVKLMIFRASHFILFL